jgi:hypothetical protein
MGADQTVNDASKMLKFTDYAIRACGGLFLLVAIFSASKLSFDLPNMVRLTVFVAIPALLGLALARIVPLSFGSRLLLMLCIISAFVTFYGFEGWLRYQSISHLENTIEDLEEKTGVTYDRRDRVEVISNMRAQGKPAFPNNPRMFLPGAKEGSNVIWPIANRSNVQLVVCNEYGTYYIPNSDRYGQTNPDSVYDIKPTVAVLTGDSFAQGGCVDEHTAVQVRKKIPGTVNFGMVGAGPGLQYAMLKEYMGTVKPKFVFWLYFENDLSDFFDEMRHPVLRKYIADPSYSQNLANRQDEIDALIDDFMTGFEDKRSVSLLSHEQTSIKGFLLLRKMRQFFNLNLIGHRRFGNDLSVIKTVLPEFGRIMGRTRKMVAEQGGELVFVYLPSSIHFVPGAYTEREDHKLRDQVIDIVKELDIPVLDGKDAFNEVKNPQERYFWYVGSHYNQGGYGIIADLIVDHIESNTP